jgi:ATP-binding cassette subfamily C protein LapB
MDLLGFEGKHWFWGTMKMVAGTYRNVFIASLLINFFVIATPLYTMNVYDRVVPNGAIDTLWVLSIGIIAIYGIDLTLKFIRSYMLEVAGKKSDIIMSSIIFEKVMDLKMSAMPKSIGSFANVLKEFESIRNFMTSSTITILIDIPFVIIFLVTINQIAGSMVFIPIVTMLAIQIYTITLKGRVESSIKHTYKANSNKNGVLIESLASIETLKTMGATGYAQWKWEEATGNIAEKSIKTKFLTASISSVTSFVVQLNTVAMMIFGVYMITNNNLTMGGLIAAVIISTRAIAPMGQLASLFAQYHHTKTAYAAINRIMELPAEHPEGKKFVQRTEFKGNIELRNVSFFYPETSKAALIDVSTNIKSGEHVGIIGKIGSGKSTIQKLLLGLHYCDEGSIFIDGIDIKQLDPAELRKNIAYVPQDITLFSGTVRENLIYRAPHATDEAILHAAEISGVSSFVNKHPLGFDMPVGERGSMISGGQRQSIAIARAIMLDSPIVILDEPTNAMDSTTEAMVIRNLKESLRDKTIILVTHKTSVLSLADRVLVMEDGKLAIDGSKEDVVSRLKKKK